MTFLGARTARHPAVAIAGVPYEATSTFRTGSAQGPAAIRWASQSIETYSPVLERDLDDLAIADLGDLNVANLEPEQMVNAVIACVAGIDADALPLLLGGEHTVSLGAVRALAPRYPDLTVVQLDAHTDLRDEYEGRRISHATVMRRIIDVVEAGAIVQAGIRAGTRKEFDAARGLRYSGPRLNIPAAVWSWLEQRPVYVSIDIDVCDPSAAPGTGNPEPEGIPAGDLLTFVRRLGRLTVVGLDVVEVSPPYDPSGRTAVLAATIVREAILAIRGNTVNSE